MAPTKNKWAFSFFWINLAVVMVVLIQIAANQISSTRDLLHVLAYALVYANLTGALGVLVLGGLAERLALRKLPLIPVVGRGHHRVAALGCLIAQTLLMEIGFVIPQHFWPEYFTRCASPCPWPWCSAWARWSMDRCGNAYNLWRRRLHEKEVAEERAQKLAAEARLRSLESRIHPHFLFNTLNSISSLIAVNPARAEQIVGRLAVLLRASLDTSNQPLIPLREELAMVESYVDIERVRFGDKLRGSVKVPAELQDAASAAHVGAVARRECCEARNYSAERRWRGFGHRVGGKWQLADRGSGHGAGFRLDDGSLRPWAGQPGGTPRCAVRR